MTTTTNRSPPTGPDDRQWQRIAETFEAALGVPRSLRPAHLAAICGDDPELRREVEAMLEAHDSGAPLLFEDERARAVDGEPRPSDLAPGTRVGPWQIDRLVGEGGMGEVYRAERVDGSYHQVAALKVLRPGYRTAETIRRFRIERHALARLEHESIATLLDGGTLPDGRPYLVLQYVEGEPITRFCAKRHLSLEESLRLFVRVARAVAFAHAKLVIHRDIKPSNILVEADGTPRLLDFGIARLLDVSRDDSLVRATRPENRLLTPEHAAPEQLRGDVCDTRTDVYGLGVLLFELLTGHTPFSSGRGLAELERTILDEAAPVPSQTAVDRTRRRHLRGDLDLITATALRKEPDRRYPSAAALADDVERYLDRLPVRARPDRLGYRVTMFLSRNRPWVAGGTILAAVVLGFAVTATLQARRLASERDRAERERAAAEEVVAILTGLFERANPRIVPGGDTLRVTALLDEAEARVERLADDPTRQAALLRTVGLMHAARGQFQRAEALLRRSVDLQWKTSGPDDLEAARTYHELALVVGRFRGGEAARPLLDSSIARLRRLEGEKSPRLAVALIEAAGFVPTRAPALIEEVTRRERQVANPDSIIVAGRLHAEATALLAQGRPLDAVERFRAALAILASRLGPDDPDRLTVANNLATALGQAGAFAQAESLQRVAVAAAERTHAPAGDRGGAIERLALTVASLGSLAEAERLERTALGLYREGLASHHPLVGSALRNLGLIVAARGRTAEGLEFLDSALAQARAAGGPSQPEAVAYLIGQRTPLLLRLGRLDEAVAAATLADSVLQAGTGSARNRRDPTRWVAMAAFARGRYDTVVTRASAALEGQRLEETAYRPQLALIRCLLGAGLAARGDADEARNHLIQACPVHDAWGLADPLVTRWGREARAKLP